MTYEYKCTNIQCKKRNEVVVVYKPMDEACQPEMCEGCKESMQRVFGSPAVKTGDGYKS